MSSLRANEAGLRWQSTLLVWVCAPFLLLGVARLVLFFFTIDASPENYGFLIAIPVASIGFALVVYLARAATTPAACAGGVMVFCLIAKTSVGIAGAAPTGASGIFRSALPALMLLFVLTFLGTRWRRGRKAELGVAEARTGRTTSQVLANLAVACLFPAFVAGGGVYLFAAVLAALGEATADTLSSEVGQAVGGRTFMLTTLKPVEVGADGGVSLMGTLAGLVGAAVVVAAGAWAMGLGWKLAGLAYAGAVVGLFFDSLLGATAERRGWINNDVVNFLSTLAAAVAGGLLLLV